MKKKLLFIFSAMCLLSTVQAAEMMDFATVLSYPVGTFKQVDVKRDANMYQLNFCNSNVSTGQLTAKTVNVSKNLSVNDTLRSSESMNVYVDNGMYIKGNRNFRGGSLEMNNSSNGLQVAADFFMAVGFEGGTKELAMPNTLAVDGLQIDSGKINGHLLTSYSSTVNANADWITIGTVSTCITNLKNKGIPEAKATGYCNAKILTVKECPSGQVLQSDGTCKKQCIATMSTSYLEGSATDTCDHNASTQVSWTNGQVVADSYCNNVHSCVDVYYDNTSQNSWATVRCYWTDLGGWSQPSGDHCGLAVAYPEEPNGMCATTGNGIFWSGADCSCEHVTIQDFETLSVEDLCEKEGGSCECADQNKCYVPTGPDCCSGYKLDCVKNSEVARHGTWTFNWAQ